LAAQNLAKDRDGFPTQGNVIPGDFWDIADIVQAKDEDHYYSGREDNTPANADQVRVKCPMDFSGVFDFTDVDENGAQDDTYIDFTGSRGTHPVDHGAKCKVEQAALKDLLDSNGLQWKDAVLPNLEDYDAPLPGNDYDISQMVAELNDANRGKQYYLSRLGDKSTWAPDVSRGDIEPNSITVTCNRRGGQFAGFSAAGVILGKKCFKNQLVDRPTDNLASHNLERKPDENGLTFSAWASTSYIAPGNTFGFADKVQGISQMHASTQTMVSEWGHKAADDSQKNNISADCDAADGSLGAIAFSSDDWKPRKKCPKKIDAGSNAASLLDAEGLQVTAIINAAEDGTNFILAGEDFAVGDRVEARDVSWHYDDNGQGADAVKITCANTLDATAGTYVSASVDRDNNGVVSGKKCNLATNSATSLDAAVAANNLEVVSTTQTILPGETASIKNDVQGAGQDLGDALFPDTRYHLNVGTGDVEADCDLVTGDVNLVTVSGDASIGKYCEPSDASLTPLLADIGVKLTASGLAGASPTVPEQDLDLAKTDALEAVDNTWNYVLDPDATGAQDESAIKATCNKTTGEFDSVTRDDIANRANIDLGRRCALLADDGKTPGGKLAEHLLTNHLVLEVTDMRVFTPNNGLLTNPSTQNDLLTYVNGGAWVSATSTMRNPRETIQVGKLVSANPQTHHYKCNRDPDAAMQCQIYSTDSDLVPALAGCDCKHEYVVVTCNGANGEFDSVALEPNPIPDHTPLLSALQSCDENDMESGSLNAMLANSGLTRDENSTACDPTAGCGTTAPGAKLDIGTAVKALDETYHTPATQASDVQLTCDGKTGEYSGVSFAAGKETQRTCSKDAAGLGAVLASQGLKAKDDYDGAGYAAPGDVLAIGAKVEVNPATHEDGTYKRSGTPTDADFTVECKSDGTFFDAQFAAAADKPDVKDNTATVINASLDLTLVVEGASQQVNFSEDATFRALVASAIESVIADQNVGDNLRSIDVSDITTNSSSNSSGTRRLAEVAARVQAAVNNGAERRQLKESVGLQVNYNIILANEVPEAIVQDVMSKVSKDDSQASELFAMKLDDSLTAELEKAAEKAEAEAAATGSPVKPMLFQITAVTANGVAERTYAARNPDGSYTAYGGAIGGSNVMYGRGRGGNRSQADGLVSAAGKRELGLLTKTSVLVAALAVAGWGQ
jgi:hypothetical protein